MKIYGFSNKGGYSGLTVGIECDIRNGFPGFDIVGLPDTGIRESKERVRSAIRNSGFKFPQQRVLISLYPAWENKSGSLLDLGIALSILLASSKVNASEHALNIMTAGELTLGGEVVPGPQALGAVSAAEKAGCSLCLVPFRTDNSSAHYISNLRQAYAVCMRALEEPVMNVLPPVEQQEPVFADVIGMEEEKDVLCLAAAGFHSMFLFGPPGVGKTLLCSRLNLLLPDNSGETADEVTRIYGCSGLSVPGTRPMMRKVTVDTGASAFCSSKLPGEGSLAHGGVLMLDEVNKLSPKLVESIKTAYDSGFSGLYPAKFLMSANMNVCPCGCLGRSDAVCTCTLHKLESYWKRPGTAFLERFDIRFPVKPFDMMGVDPTSVKPDSFYRDRVLEAAERQKHRYRDFENIGANGQVHLNPSAVRLLSREADLVVSMAGAGINGQRNLIGAVTLARTVADMDQCADVKEEHVERALELRKYGFGDYYWKELR